MKKIISLLLCILLLAGCSKQPTTQQPPSSPVQSETPKAETPAAEPETVVEAKAPSAEPATETVTVKVIGLEDEVMFTESVEYREGITAFDILTEVAKSKEIPVVYSGGKSSPYITSINGLSEKQHGDMSGWIFTVNGESIMTPSNKTTLNPNDTVEWTYITEFTF